jgi:hypothetical protein
VMPAGAATLVALYGVSGKPGRTKASKV